jgi:hypothetical protein
MTTETLMSEATTPTVATPSTTDAQTTTASAAGASTSTQQTPAAEATTSEAPTTAKAEDAASATPERAAPEKYEFKLPEGKQLDADVIGEFEGIARELKMPQEEAQTLVEKLAPKIAESFQRQQADAVERAAQQWRADATADKEFGGDKLTESLALGEKALTAFGTPALRQLLIDSRLGNHPEVIRMMVKAGKALSEDSRVVTSGQPTSERSAAEIFYPTQH